MAEESNNFTSMIVEERRKLAQYKDASMMFGKISILSNIRDSPQSIYLMCTSRGRN